MHKILIIRLSSIGDIILTTPLIRCIKKQYPNSEITFIVKKQYVELLSCSPYIDHLIAFDSKKGFRELKLIKEQLQACRFDLFIDIHKNLRSLYLRRGIHAKKITTYSKQIFKRTCLIWFGINLYKEIKPVYLRYFEAVEKLKVAYDGAGTEITIPKEKTTRVSQMVTDSGYNGHDPVIVLCPSATYLNKKWMPENFIELANTLIREKSAFIVLLGGPDDVTLCNDIASHISHSIINFSGQFSLLESAALLGLSHLVIANDSGLLHLAQSQKTPVIGIYGPTTRELGFFPIEKTSLVIEHPIKCRPCTHKGLDKCPHKHFRCMKNITVAEVCKAAITLLS